MSTGIYTTHSDWFEVIMDKPFYPSIGWSSTLEGARAITAAYLREMRKHGYSVRVVEKGNEGTVYCVSKRNHHIRVWLDCPKYEVDYQIERQKEIKAELAKDGPATRLNVEAAEAERKALEELDAFLSGVE